MAKTNFKSSTLQLADQINDEFLTCKICYEPFKEPKSLSCLHTFCEQCIDQHVEAQRTYKYTDYREFACPICRKKTVIPTGGCRKLNDNFLVSSLSELLSAKQKSIRVPHCEICKLTTNVERVAALKCVECQKLMCHTCSDTHKRMKITNNHNLYELETEKDIMCKTHSNEIVRFFCEQCETCVCVACTYTDHCDHDLVDFKDAILHHKEKLEENLRKCRVKIGEIRTRLDTIRQCEAHIDLCTNDIRSTTIQFIQQLEAKERELTDSLKDYFGDDAGSYIRKKDELETLLDQLKSTCSLGDVVVKGKDIEILLLKKQLCEKFLEFQNVQMDSVPVGLFKRVHFEPGTANLGGLIFPDGDSTDMSEKFSEKSTQVDTRKLNIDNFREVEVQTDIRMIHDLAVPSYRERFGATAASPVQSKKPSYEHKHVQTDEDSPLNGLNLISSQSFTGAISSQSSIEEEQTSPIDVNKLSKRVKRYVNSGCVLAVLPVNNDILVMNPLNNSITILDKRGKKRYALTAKSGLIEAEKNCCKFLTPQGVLTLRLEIETKTDKPLTITKKDPFDNLPETSA